MSSTLPHGSEPHDDHAAPDANAAPGENSAPESSSPAASGSSPAAPQPAYQPEPDHWVAPYSSSGYPSGPGRWRQPTRPAAARPKPAIFSAFPAFFSTVLGSLAAYVVGLIAAALALACAYVAGLLKSGPSGVGSTLPNLGPIPLHSGLFQQPGFLLSLPTQLVSMAFFGSENFHFPLLAGGGQPGAGDAVLTFSLRFVPVLVLAAVLVAAFRIGRRIERKHPDQPLGAATRSAVVGSTLVAILSTVLTVVTAAHFRVGDDAGGLTHATMHAAGVVPFVAIAALLAAALVLGRVSVQLPPRPGSRVSALLAASRLAFLYVALYCAIAFVALAVGGIAITLGRGEDVAGILRLWGVLVLLAPLLVAQYAACLLGLGHLGTLDVSLNLGDLSNGALPSVHRALSVFAAAPWVAAVAIALAVVCILVASAVWAKAHGDGAGALRRPFGALSWLALPLAFLALGALLAWVSSLGFGAALRGSYLTAQDLASAKKYDSFIGLASWLPLVLAAVGLAIEALSRFVAPRLPIPAPARLVRRVRGGSASAAGDLVAPESGASANTAASAGAITADTIGTGTAGTTAATGTTATSASASALAPSPTGANAALADLSGGLGEPRSSHTKRNLIAGAIVAVVVLLVALVLLLVPAINRDERSPQARVRAYLTAVQEGRFGDAAEMAPPTGENTSRVLLTNEVGQATRGGVEDFEIEQVTQQGDSARVDAVLTVGGHVYPVAYRLERRGKTAFLLDNWDIVNPPYSTAIVPDLADIPITVNGQRLDTSLFDDEADNPREGVPALPGHYTFSGITNSPDFKADPASSDVVPGRNVTKKPRVFLNLTDAAMEHINDTAKAQVDVCLGDETAPRPTKAVCKDLKVVADVPDGVKGTWKVERYPVATDSDMDDLGKHRGRFTTGIPGRATYTYTPAGGGPARTATASLQLTGTLLIYQDNELDVDFSGEK